MNPLNLRRLLGIKAVCIPVLILLILFVFAYFSEVTHVSYVEGYDVISKRSSASFVPNSPDIDIVVTISKLNPSALEIDYSFYIHAWLDINISEIWFRMDTFHSSEFLSMKNLGVASYNSETGEAWGRYYQIETQKQMKENVSGFPQKYPYDYYTLSFSFIFLTEGLKPTFDDSFQPTVFISAIYGWKTEAYSKPIDATNKSFELDVRVVVARETLTAVLQFMIPTTAIYFLMGCSLFTGSNNKSKKLRDRITICLTTSVLILSLYTFLLRPLEWVPLYIQGLAISLVVSNIIILSFSVVGSSSESINSASNWDMIAMTLASITPILYLLISGYSLMSRLFQFIVADPLWILQEFLLAYIDYRFFLWLIIFQLSFWAVYLYKERALLWVTISAGFGIFVVNSLRVGISHDITFTIISIVVILFSAILLFRSFKEKLMKKIYSFLKSIKG